MFPRMIVVALCAVVARSTAEAQVVTPGGRARVIEAASARPLITGELVRLSGDTAIILTGMAVTPFVIGPEHRLQMSVGTRGRAGRGIAFGGLIGFATGALLGLATHGEPSGCSSWCIDFGPGASAFGGGIVDGLAGIVIGGIAGANTKQDVWGTVNPTQR